MLLKKINVLLICFIIAVIPCIYSIDFSYAEDEPTATNWLPCDSEEMIVRGAKAFLKVNNFYWTYSPVGQFYKWTYNHLEEQASNQGYTMTEISQGMKYRYLENGKIQFYFTAGCLQMLNNVYEGMLNNLGITPNSFKTVYSGKYYKDANNNKIMVFMAKSNIYNSWSGNRLNVYNYFDGLGQKWLHNGSDYASLNSVTFPVPNGDRTFNISTATGQNYGAYQEFRCIDSVNNPVYVTSGYHSGYDSILYSRYFDKFYICTFIDFDWYNSTGQLNYRTIKITSFGNELPKTNDNNGNASVNANQGNEPQNPFEPDTDYTIDEPDDDNDEPVTTPVEPEPPNDPNTGGGTTNNNGDTTFNFFIVPNLPDLNPDPQNIPNKWKIPNLQQKFPFCIPFDLIAIYSVLDTEPQAPKIQQTVDFGGFTYNLDINLNTYDSAMVNIRKFILVLYIFGLLFVTPSILKT